MATTTLDTASVAAEDRLDFWCSTVCDQFVALDVQPAPEVSLWGRVIAGSVGQARLRRIGASAHRFVRTPGLIRAADEDYYQLALARRGHTVVVQDGRETTIGPGEFVLYDSSRPFRFETEREFEYSVCLFPKHLLGLRRRELDAAPAIRFGGRRGVGAMVPPLFAALHRLDADELSTASEEAMMRALGDLFVALVRSQVAPDAAPSVHLLRARAYIAEHIGEPDLDPARVAAACAISASYLHKLFAEAGATVSGEIRERRLQGCWEDLRSAEPTWSVAAIGLRWGLADPAQLSRSFRARFGLSPSAHRRRSGAGIAPAPTA